MKKVYLNTWSSIVALCNEFIVQFKAEYPQTEIKLIDWESANINELPNADLIGPASLFIRDHGEQIEVNFAIGVSTYTGDTNLFRHRTMVGAIFDRLIPEMKVDYMESDTVSKTSVLVCTEGTMISPMSKMDTRPWQYVQVSSWLLPSGEVA